MTNPSKAEALIELARKEFETDEEKLSEADIKLFTAVANGEPAKYFVGDLDDVDPGLANDWGDDRTLDANRIIWLCTDAQVCECVTYKGINVLGARIVSDLNLAYAEIPFPLQLIACQIDSQIVLLAAETKRLDFSRSHVDSLNADGIKVTGTVFLNDEFTAFGEVRLFGATIGGDLDCSLGSFNNVGGDALSADGARVNGTVYLNREFCAIGKVRMVGATIGGTLDCRRAAFNNEGGDALSADRAQVMGTVFLNDEFTAFGEVRLLGATIGGDLDCSGGSFNNVGGDALSADGARVNGTVFLNDEFEVIGKVRLLRATIEGDLVCRRGVFKREGGDVFGAHRMQVKGNVFLDGEFNAIGNMLFNGATIGGALTMTGVVDPRGCSLNLTDATVGILKDNEKSWPASITMDGFVYKRIEPAAPEMRLRWLNRHSNSEFRPQPYDQLASVLVSMGHPDFATEIRIAKERAIAKFTRPHPGNLFTPRLWWYRVWGPLIGYGYQTWKAFVFALVFMAIGLIAFGIGHQHDIMTPAIGNAYADDPAWDADVAKLYPKFNPVMYTIDVFVPIIDFGQAKYWLPNPHRGEIDLGTATGLVTVGGLLRAYMWLHITAGWVLSTLLVIGFSGIVRNRE